MPYRRNYPMNASEVLDPPVRFKRETIEAVQRFAASKPWRGTLDQRRAKFDQLHADLCRIYGRRTILNHSPMHEDQNRSSGSSYYAPGPDIIVLRNRLSVVTYLHEFAHALGRDERGAVRWSLNLFRLCFPRSFARARQVGHTLVAN